LESPKDCSDCDLTLKVLLSVSRAYYYLGEIAELVGS